MSDGFAAPGSMDGLEYEAMNGHLLVVEPTLYEAAVNTSLGTKDAVRANVLDVTAQAVYSDVLIFPRVLCSSLRGRIGQKVLAHLGQGVAKPGQNAPWILKDATGDAAAVTQATSFIQATASKTYTAPATSPAAQDVANAQNLASVFGAKEVAPPF